MELSFNSVRLAADSARLARNAAEETSGWLTEVEGLDETTHKNCEEATRLLSSVVEDLNALGEAKKGSR